MAGENVMAPYPTKSEILVKLHQLPTMPVVIQEVLASFNDDSVDSATLAHKIERDQGLSARVLRVANSSFYGLPRRIGSIQDAIVVMGFSGVRSLVLSVGFIQAFPSPGNVFDRHAHWQRSFRVAAYSKALAQCLMQDQQMAFTAGMFHDVGQLVLDVCMPQQFSEMLAQQKISGLSLIEVEQSILGFDHALIGAEMARLWNFPAEIEHAIHYWRTPEYEPSMSATDMVHVAVLLDSGLSGAALISRLPKILCERLRLSWARIETCIPKRDQLDAGASLMLGSAA